MSYTFRKAVRADVPLLIGIAGGTGAGKTFSLLELAKGMTPAGKRFAFIDTEAGRGLAYADQFDYDYVELRAPFTPERYIEVIHAADKAGYPVIVIDSFSHEYSGHGGLLDWHEDELDRMAGDNWQKRAALSVPAWSRPKQAHKQMMADLLQIRAHLLFGLRAEEKISLEKNAEGKTEIVEKRGPGGFKGWLPICEKNFPYELTCSFLLMAEAPGVPKPIKLQAQHKSFFPEGKPITAEAGRQLASWARGGTQQGVDAPAAPLPAQAAPPVEREAADPSAGSVAPEDHSGSGNAEPLWTAKELSAALSDAALSMRDLVPVCGEWVTNKDTAGKAVTGWFIANPGKRVPDLIAAAIAAHTHSPPQEAPAEQASLMS